MTGTPAWMAAYSCEQNKPLSILTESQATHAYLEQAPWPLENGRRLNNHEALAVTHVIQQSGEICVTGVKSGHSGVWLNAPLRSSESRKTALPIISSSCPFRKRASIAQLSLWCDRKQANFLLPCTGCTGSTLLKKRAPSFPMAIDQEQETIVSCSDTWIDW